MSRAALRQLPVFAGPLPSFDVEAAADTPAEQFRTWLAAAIEAGIPEPHAMTLSTVDAAGLPAARTVILKNVAASGWQFAGRKGPLPAAALTFYWREQGRQIRVRGPVVAESAAASAADFRARSAGSRAETLVGRQGEPLGSAEELAAAFEAALDRVDEVPAAWTLYTLQAGEVEFFQAHPSRRHIRLRYARTDAGWHRHLLWP